MRVAGARILVTGAGGFIGRRVDARLRELGASVRSSASSPPARAEFATPGDAARLVREVAPDAVVNVAAMARADECERDPDAAMRINRDATLEIAAAAREIGARLIHFSTDQVFDGASGPYGDDAGACPLHAYGRSKAAADAALLESPEGRCILRPTLVYGPSADGRSGASDVIARAAAEGRTMSLFVDELRCPVPVDFVAEAVVAALEKEAVGVINVAGATLVSRHEFGLAVCAALGIDPIFMRESSLAAWSGPPRPAVLELRCRRLTSDLGLVPPHLGDGLTPAR